MGEKAGRRKRRKLTRATEGQLTALQQTVHDRKARELPTNATVRAIEVPDPYEAGATIAVIASLRDDPLGRMHDRHQIDDAQYAAGRHYQALHEAAEVSGVRAMNTTNEPVDGRGASSFPFTDRQLRAMRELGEISRQLRGRYGTDGEALVRNVLIDRMFLGQVLEARGVLVSERALRNFGWYLRQCLEAVAIALGYAQPRR